jgi:crotonobetainyl-CoA:carnitine CoA-transferase CaiB-like acyl-CoA transferase
MFELPVEEKKMSTSESERSPMPLEGIRILDLGTMTPGKYCTLLLADLGAEVIRVERHTAVASPITEEDVILNRNKRSIALNLRSDEGRQVFYRLAKNVDVVLESNRPGTVKRLGVDYETLKVINPGLIYCSLSGVGQEGPYSQLPGFDIIFMALGGLLGLLGGKNRPPIVPGAYISDAGSGLIAVIGILTALLARHTTGKGQYVDIAMLDGVLSLLSTVSGFQRPSGEPAQAESLGRVMPGYNVYETGDEKYLTLGIFRYQSWQSLCQVLGREDFIEHQWATGSKQEEILSFFEKIFRTKTRDEWCRQLRELDIEVAPVNDLEEVYCDPQVIHRRMVVEVEHPATGKIKQLGIPIKFSDTPGQIRNVAPSIGEDTKVMLKELGYSEDDIEALRATEAI